MARCKSCGAEISWVKTTAGKLMPVDEPGIPYIEDPSGKEVFVTYNGAVVRGNRRSYSSGSYPIGHISHFVTCPNADRHRRSKCHDR